MFVNCKQEVHWCIGVDFADILNNISPVLEKSQPACRMEAIESVMDLYLSSDDDFTGQGGRISVSTFDAGTVDDYLDFMRRRPRGHGLAINIPNRNIYRGNYSLLHYQAIAGRHNCPILMYYFRAPLPLQSSGRKRSGGTEKSNCNSISPRSCSSSMLSHPTCDSGRQQQC